MPVKIKGTVKLKKNIRDFIPDARSAFAIEVKRSIIDLIVEKISSGISPVKGQNRYPKYSSGYSKVKGRKAPVDLIKSGNMLNNMIAKITKSKDIIIEFRDKKAGRLANYHTKGAGNLPVRKVLPQGKEIFKKDIMNNIYKILRKSIRLSIKKNKL